jgi:hypothetical protein
VLAGCRSFFKSRCALCVAITVAMVTLLGDFAPYGIIRLCVYSFTFSHHSWRAVYWRDKRWNIICLTIFNINIYFYFLGLYVVKFSGYSLQHSTHAKTKNYFFGKPRDKKLREVSAVAGRIILKRTLNKCVVRMETELFANMRRKLSANF